MDLTPTQLQQLIAAITLINGLVSAGVALGVAWLGHRFTLKREQRKEVTESSRERRSELRRKLEELVEQVEANEAYRSSEAKLTNRMLIARDRAVEVQRTPTSGDRALDRALALQSLYFPQLLESMEAIRAASIEHLQFLSNELGTATDAWRALQPTFPERNAHAIAPLVRANQRLLIDARNVIERTLSIG